MPPAADRVLPTGGAQMTTGAWGHSQPDEVSTSAHLRTPSHHQLEREPTPTPADWAEDAAFAVLLISAAAIVDAILALLVITYLP